MLSNFYFFKAICSVPESFQPKYHTFLILNFKAQPTSIKKEYHAAARQSPSRDLTLCPITGKVLGQAEGEPTPTASPEPEQMLTQQQQHHSLEHNIKQEQFSMQQDEQEQLQMQLQQQHDEQSHQPTAFMNENGEVQQMMMNDDGTPILVTGEDGTVYQVAGKNEQGQTILIAQGSDGEQQCVYVTSDDAIDENGIGANAGDSEMLTLDTAVAEAVQQQHNSEQVRRFIDFF